MFKLPDKIPSFRDDVSDIVDFFESECLKSEWGRTSFVSIHRAIALGDDEVEPSGIEDENDIFLNKRFDEVCGEIQRRKEACGGRYPFTLKESGYVLNLELPIDDWITVSYAYLLFATRMNMLKDRVQGEIDGTLLFEKLSADVAKNYWGERADSFPFGTSMPGNFPHKVDELCSKIGEGQGFYNRNKSKPTEKDGKLDVVVWKSFEDKNTAKLIGFGQCKTGTHWENTITQLQPASFCQSWFQDMPAVHPVRLFFISDSFPLEQWYSIASSSGIIFDRFRIMDFLSAPSEEPLENEIRTWVRTALEFIKS